MKRTMLWLLVVVSIIFSLKMCVLAHSGRTDGSGGHRDSSTGEYHYHHGYSAHDHYDMDGDGDKDCPYEFKDKTDYYDSYKSSNDVGDKYTQQNSNHEDEQTKSTSSKDVPWYVVVLVSILCVSVYVFDYKVLDGKILGFFLTVFCGILFSPIYIFGALHLLIEWITEKIKSRK